MFLTLLICALEILTNLSPASAQYDGPPLPPPETTQLGYVDGKSYYYNDSQIMDWQSASQFCQSFGWRLAEIRTQAQHDFFVAKSQNEGFIGQYWLGARDSSTVGQYSWDGIDWSRDNRLKNFGQQILLYHQPQMCLLFESYDLGAGYKRSYWSTQPCVGSSAAILCENIPRINYYKF
ncbi:uncharacterized protein LOC110861202 [Folsomia candida]|uniref:C-type lectin domain family 4 member F n=1 Tax=Folsomia candida TaxID=158441 RepID=A0A226D3Z6_FOLCA|nr:uncharacterized protein LOC110861202 [Folsomia candida]OXA39538.1 C-type lectin domain family 4 member F [Folsomia candida]